MRRQTCPALLALRANPCIAPLFTSFCARLPGGGPQLGRVAEADSEAPRAELPQIAEFHSLSHYFHLHSHWRPERGMQAGSRGPATHERGAQQVALPTPVRQRRQDYGGPAAPLPQSSAASQAATCRGAATPGRGWPWTSSRIQRVPLPRGRPPAQSLAFPPDCVCAREQGRAATG